MKFKVTFEFETENREIFNEWLVDCILNPKYQDGEIASVKMEEVKS